MILRNQLRISLLPHTQRTAECVGHRLTVEHNGLILWRIDAQGEPHFCSWHEKLLDAKSAEQAKRGK